MGKASARPHLIFDLSVSEAMLGASREKPMSVGQWHVEHVSTQES